jgi:hypothetical protein
MNDNPTLRDVAQAFDAWLTAQSQTVRAWLSSLGDIHVSTIMAIVSIGFTFIFVWVLLDWLVRLTALAGQYRALRYPWPRALRLAQADIEDERTRKRQKTNSYYRGQPSQFAATPTEREAWAQDLEQERHSP